MTKPGSGRCETKKSVTPSRAGYDNRSKIIRRSRRKLIREHLGLADLRCCGEKFGGMRHECRGDLASEMRLAACLVIEGVEDRESVFVVAHSEPGHRAGFGRNQALSVREESGNFFFLPRLCLEFDVERNTGHNILSSCSRWI